MNTCVLLFQKNLVKNNLDKKEETKMTFEELKEIIAEILGADEADITPEANLIEDLEADSLSIMELHMEIEEKTGIKIPDEAIVDLHTVQDVLDAIEANK